MAVHWQRRKTTASSQQVVLFGAVMELYIKNETPERVSFFYGLAEKRQKKTSQKRRKRQVIYQPQLEISWFI